MSDFYSAKDARSQATLRRPVINEIQIIETKIADAIEDGALSVKVGPTTSVSTGLTNSDTAYEAWSDPYSSTTDDHNVARLQMNQVIAHFSKLGYTITRVRYQQTSTFDWVLSW